MVVQKNYEFYVVRTDFSEEDLRKHLNYQRGFMNISDVEFIKDRGVILSMTEDEEEKCAFCNMEGQCIWVEPDRNIHDS